MLLLFTYRPGFVHLVGGKVFSQSNNFESAFKTEEHFNREPIYQGTETKAGMLEESVRERAEGVPFTP